MAKRPHANNLCGAKTRAGHPCKNRAMPNGRCRMHGGSSTGPPKKNQNAKRHGFFSKYIPEETLEIMGNLDSFSPADLIWDQITIQYAAIIRAQNIMYVENKDEIIKEIKKEKESEFGSETEYEFQFAWDRHATLMNAQSRAMSELRSLVKQFDELADAKDERKLKLQIMQANVEKVKAEVDLMTGDNDSNVKEQIDSYVDALNKSAKDVWQDETD